MDGTLITSATVNKTSKRPYSGPLVSEVLDMRVWEGVSGPVWEVGLEGQSEGHLGSYLRPYLDLSEKPHRNPEKRLHLAVGRALRLIIV